MTLDEAVRHFRWDATHDYLSHETKDGKIVALIGLGLYFADLRRLIDMVPNLSSIERRRMRHDRDDWVRVDLWVTPWPSAPAATPRTT